MAKVVVGMSGGVDSSVAALLLKQQGHEVIALFMRNWNEASVTLEDECPWIDDSRDAMMVAEQLGIPFQVLDLSAEYKERIVDYMFREYSEGKTPNPDVLCNREIKFDIFLKAALTLGADFVATGHYVRKSETIENGKSTFHLLSGKDPNKDQSYFLCQLSQEQLSKSLFPIGEMLKPEVRELAENAGFLTASKKDSQGLCFIGKVSLPDFLQQQLKPKMGEVIEIDASYPGLKFRQNLIEDGNANSEQMLAKTYFSKEDGKVVGQHNGAHYYTVGQRKGLHIGGMTEPLFVLQTNVKTNEIFVGKGSNHPGLYSRAVEIEPGTMHWVLPEMKIDNGGRSVFDIRIRYRQKLFPGTLHCENDRYFAVFEKAEKAVTPGQFIAFYRGDELVASGVMQ